MGHLCLYCQDYQSAYEVHYNREPIKQIVHLVRDGSQVLKGGEVEKPVPTLPHPLPDNPILRDIFKDINSQGPILG